MSADRIASGLLYRRCAVCGADDPVPFVRASRAAGPVVRCAGCAFVYVSPIDDAGSLILDGPEPADAPLRLRHSALVADITSEWDWKVINDYLREADGRRANALSTLRRIEQFVPHPGRLLDIGSFCGLLVGLAAERGWECCGLEPLVGPAIYARARYGVPIVTDTLRDSTFPPESFDLVTALQVFEHLVDPGKAIAIIERILKPGGIVVIEVPRIDTWAVRLLGRRHRHFVEDHVSFFSAATLTRLVEAHGLRVQETYAPDRSVSIAHLAWWVGRSSSRAARALARTLGERGRRVRMRIRPGDIVAVVAEKAPR